MLQQKEDVMTAVMSKFTTVLDEDKKMFVLGFMEGVQAERAAAKHRMDTQKQPA